MTRSRFWSAIFVLFLSFRLLAQSNFCAEFLLPMLEQVSDTCHGLGRNEICYGNTMVEASFSEQMTSSFTNPSDIAPVPYLNSLRTSAYDSDTGLFGVAVMHVQASNIPNTLPGQVLTFLLMGDVTVQNAVAPEEAFVPVDPIEVFTSTAANIRVSPNSNSGIAWSVAANTRLSIDARNEAGDWFRVVGTGQIAWISTTVLVQNESMSSLPVFNRASRTAMQAFYFHAGIGNPNCEEAPNQLIIQGPRGMVTNLTINGTELRIGSTIAISQPTAGVLRVAVLDGDATVNQVTVPSGFSIDARVNENIIQPSTWGNFQPLQRQELEFHQETTSSLGEDIVTYIPDVPTVQEVREMEEALAPQPTAIPTNIATLTPVSNSVTNHGSGSGSGGGGGGGGGTCYTNGGSISFNYVGPGDSWGNRAVYSNTTCSGTSNLDYAHAVITANDSGEALTKCGNIGGGYIAFYQDFGWNTPSNWYECGY